MKVCLKCRNQDIFYKFSIVKSGNKIKYIDTIIPSPLLLKSLYSKDLIESSGVHCFIYFQKNDTFVTIYSEKEFLYTKSIKYSFNIFKSKVIRIVKNFSLCVFHEDIKIL